MARVMPLLGEVPWQDTITERVESAPAFQIFHRPPARLHLSTAAAAVLRPRRRWDPPCCPPEAGCPRRCCHRLGPRYEDELP